MIAFTKVSLPFSGQSSVNDGRGSSMRGPLRSSSKLPLFKGDNRGELCS